MAKLFSSILIAVLASIGIPASAQTLSTSIMHPSAIDPITGAISGALPGASGAKIYYLSADLKTGTLMTQMRHTGRNGEMTLSLLSSDARVKSWQNLGNLNKEATRNFEIDAAGTYNFRLEVGGDENGRFCVLFGGTALPTATGQDCYVTAAATRPVPADAPVTPAPAAAAAPAPAASYPVGAAAPAASVAPAPTGVAAELSTSMSEPTPIETLNGVILGKMPGATAKTYYLSADLKAGLLMAQAEDWGRGGEIRRSIELSLLDPDMRTIDSVWHTGSSYTAENLLKAWPIDSSRRAVLSLKVEGDELGSFCVLFGGTALRALKPSACPPRVGAAASTNPDEYSTTVFQPSDGNYGFVAGKLPGGDGAFKFYILSADLKAGSLLTQLELKGRTNKHREATVSIYDSNLHKKDSYWLIPASNKDQKTRTIEIDSSGQYLIKLAIQGEETGNFCLLLGGTALPSGGAEACPEKAAAATPMPTASKPVIFWAPAPIKAPPPAPKAFEVITSKCEERLRVGSDFLFDFDRSDVRPEADEALHELAKRIGAVQQRVIIEGHTDGKGTDGYNQGLSERRAAAVRVALMNHGLPGERLVTHGFGKSRQIAPNQYDDGTDDPVGRQKNRRVEVVINTCA